MPNLDIYTDEAFDVVRLTKRIGDLPRIPTKIADLGLFSEEPITTTHLYIEKNASGLHLVPARARGAPGEPVHLKRGSRIPFDAFHLPQRGSVLADEVQNVKQFGLVGSVPTREEDVATAATVLDKKLKKAKQQLDLTIEWQRIGAIKGKVYDYDGTTVLLDLFSEFAVTQTTINMVLQTDTTNVRMKCVAIRRAIEAKLGGLAYTSIRALVSPEFMDLLVGHPKVDKAFELFQNGAALRNDPARKGTFDFGDILWDEYQGSMVLSPGEGAANAVSIIEPEYGYAYPTGVSELFVTTFSPADYMEAVNTPGLPYYAKQEPMEFNKGIKFESQSNPLSICTRPDAVIKVYARGS